MSAVSVIPAPSTPLGPFEDSAVTWTTWVTLMGFVGLVALALLAAAPVARRIGSGTDAPDGRDAVGRATARLAWPAALLGVLAFPAILSDLAHGASDSGGYDYGAAWDALFDGSNEGRLLGLEVTLILLGAALVAPLAVRRVAAGPARPWLLSAALACGSVALGTTKFPSAVPGPGQWGRTVFQTLMWMLHLLGGAVWIGGLAGLVLLAAPGAVAEASRANFWSPVIRRFSISAMSCVAAIGLSGLFLYWGHVDGPSQLFTTMYGRVLGVKILIFGAMMLLGAANQFWLHPRIEALREGGDHRPLRVILARHFPGVVAVELVLGVGLLFVAPFLHGSARNQAFQAELAKHVSSADQITRLAAKPVSTSTWVWGTIETIVVIAVMVGGYVMSGRIARARRRVAVA